MAQRPAIAAARAAARDNRSIRLWRDGDRMEWLAGGLLGGILVYLFYYPSDSVLVESGDALWLVMLSLILAVITALGRSGWSDRQPVGRDTTAGRLLDLSAWSLGGWMMLAAVATCPPGNLRMATNEAWLWIAAAALFTSVRRIGRSDSICRSTVLLMICGAVGLAVIGLHQQWVTLPINRAAFAKDPDAVLRAAGLDAPPGSAERAIFAGRLADGGPSGTFVLANSLGAVLMAGLMLTVGVLRAGWSSLSKPQFIAGGAAILLCGLCLIATGSRAALVSAAVGLTALHFGVARFRQQTSRRINRWLAAGVVAVPTLLVGAALIGAREWFGAARTTIAFRLQYWQATWAMVNDRPLFAAGPGNFQSIYQRYRLPVAAEQIAEPHNWVLETLASGGWIAAMLLGVGVGSAIVVYCRRRATAATTVDQGSTRALPAVWIGAASALVLIWLIGFAVLRVPEVESNLFAIPIVIVIAAVLIPVGLDIDRDTLAGMVAVTIAAVGLHLTVSGGWTVPGVAAWIWIGGGLVTSQTSRERPPATPSSAAPLIKMGALIALTITFYFVSFRPVESARRLMQQAVFQISRGRTVPARQTLEAAVATDPWSAEASMALADLYRWQLVSDQRSRNRDVWTSLLEQAKQRGGDDPALYRAIAVQQLHLYQRYGREDDLSAASNTISQAVKWAPSNQWLIAQLASIVAATGELERAQELADRAKALSELGINTERRFMFQQIYPAVHFGAEVQSQPRRRIAPFALAEQGLN